MKKSFLNIAIVYFILIQFYIVNANNSFKIINVPKTNELSMTKDCGEGCTIIRILFYTHCMCPPKPRHSSHYIISDNNRMEFPL